MFKLKGLLITSGFILSLFSIGIKANKLVIDTDAGGDDAVALSLLLSVCNHHNHTIFDIVGITCTYGNTGVKNVEQNVLKVLTVANVSHIPVYSGAFKALIKNYTVEEFFGADGLGDFEFNETLITSIDRTKHGAVALVDLARKYPGELNVLLLGPTTNVALAMLLDPSFVHNVKKFYIMGGSIAGIGNVLPGLEFNFYLDGESDFILLNSTTKKLNLLLPWETTLSTNISWAWRRDVLGSIDSRFIRFLNLAESVDKPTTKQQWNSADPLAAAVLLWPELILKSFVTNVTPLTHDDASGVLLVDYKETSQKPKNVEIVQTVDVEKYKKYLKYYLS